MISKWTQFLPVAAVIVTICGLAQGSPIVLVTPNGGKVQIQVTYKDGSSALTSAGADNGALDEDPAAGSFKFTPPNQSNVRTIEVKNLGAIAPGVAAIGFYDFGPSGMDVFVPFKLPEIGSTDASSILLTQVDVPTYAGTVSPYATGDPVNSTGGTVPGLPGVTVRDASGIYQFNSFFDVFFELDVPNIPLFTGSGVELDTVNALPEPSSFVLLTSGLGLILFIRRRR
jgi:hypothetical protein